MVDSSWRKFEEGWLLTQRGPYDLAMAGVLIGTALEAYEGDGEAVH